MDTETREALNELRDGMNDLASLMAQLSQLICYAEGITMVPVSEDDFPDVEGNA